MSAIHSERLTTSAAPTRYRPLVVVLAAVCGGIVVDRMIGVSAVWWWSAAIVSCGIWLILRSRRRDGWAAVLLLLAIACTAGSWHHLRWNLFAHQLVCQVAKVRRTLLFPILRQFQQQAF